MISEMAIHHPFCKEILTRVFFVKAPPINSGERDRELVLMCEEEV